ncbi:MAG: hypothetical protein H5T72_03635 [Actinobacteria bacterium]|nr:hypothetical protein [Actinomycetota bacterium]
MGGEIIAERFTLLKTRGSNGLAFTHIVEDSLDGRRLVVKVSDRLGILGLEYLKAANLLAENGVRGILLPLEGGLLEGDEGYYLAFPELGEPSLENYLRMMPSLTCEEVLHVLKGTLSALESLHRAGFLHLFIEPRNLFYLPRRSVTLKDPALRAEFFHPFLELVSAPDFSCLHPALMDGGLPGPEADLYALGKLAERLLASAVDGDVSPLGPALRELAWACGDAACEEAGSGGKVVETMASLRQDLERALLGVCAGGKGSEGRLRSALKRRKGRSPGGDLEVEEEYGRESLCPSGAGSSASVEGFGKGAESAAEGRVSGTALEARGASPGSLPGRGSEGGSSVAGMEPETGMGRSRLGGGERGIQPCVSGSSVEGVAGGDGLPGFRRPAWMSRFRRRGRARAFRVVMTAACIGLLISIPFYLLVAREGRRVSPALGWGASEAGGGEVLPALMEAGRGPSPKEGIPDGAGDAGIGGMAAGAETTLPSVEQGLAPQSRDAAPSAGNEVAGAEGRLSPQDPVARFTVTPSEGQSPLRVYLDASESYDPDGHIVSYQWSCGGGAKAFYHVFESNIIPARMAVTLTVTDNGGNTGSVTHYVTLY